MRELTAEQRRAITTLDRPVSLVAAAGSGKTTVLVHRYLECLRRGATPSQILAVTFTQDAARQLKTRIAATLRGDGESPEREARAKEIEGSSGIGTLHGLCHQILNQFGSLVGLPPAERILDTFEQAEVFETAYREWLESLSPEELGEWLSLYPRQALRELCAQLYSQLHTLTRSLSHPPSEPASVHRLVAAAASGWLRRCQEAQNHLGRYSFDDLEHLALRILREEPAVASRLRERFRFAMVDEFQDTSRLQWDILRRILGDSPKNLFIVGDPRQSIYSFRHADVALFHEVAHSIAGAGGESQELTANFRSAAAIIASVNALSASLFADADFSPMRPAEGAAEHEGEVRLRRYPSDSKRGADLARAEIGEAARAVAERIRQGAAPGSIALLFRVSDRIPAFAAALEAAGIPTSCRRTGRLFSTYEAADILAYLRALANPWDDFGLAALLRSPYVGFSALQLGALGESKGESLYEKLQSAGDPRAAWFLAAVESGIAEIEPALEALFASRRYWPRDPGVLLALLGPLTSGDPSLAGTIERIASWEREEILYQTEQRSATEAVELMTVHGAKGLEFDHVFIVDTLRRSGRQLPLALIDPERAAGFRCQGPEDWIGTSEYETLRAGLERVQLEESRRILYVALTRARHSLTVLLPEDASHIPRGTWGEWLAGLPTTSP